MADHLLREWLVNAGLRGRALESTLDKCESGDIYTVSDLRDVKQMPEQFSYLFPGGLSRGKIERALANDSGPNDSDDTPAAQPEKIRSAQELPEGKRYPFFASHKKSHTRFGDASADLARATKDILKYKANLDGYFDVDNLQKISQEQLSIGIVQSCSVLLFLNDETLDSAWCRHEVDEARAHGIPIICVVDVDKQTQREVIDCYMEKGFGWLFDAQVISYSSQGRDHAIDLIISAIRRAIQHCASHNTLTPTTIKTKNSPPADKQEKADVHESGAEDTAGLQSKLQQAVIAAFGSGTAAFDAHSKDGVVGKKEWKRLIKKVLPSLKPDEGKKLRKKLPTKMSSLEFCLFMGGPEDAVISSANKVKAGGKGRKGKGGESSSLASLPPEVPELPPSFRPRVYAQQQLLNALLAREGTRSTAVTAPKSRISSQGMGGVGKTMLTAAVVRDERLRAGFKVDGQYHWADTAEISLVCSHDSQTICWLNLSQQPEIMQLQRRLYGQLSDNADMPQPATKDVDSQIQELRKVAAKRPILVVLDDMWDGEHERPFSCIDPATASKLLVTTRIKGIMPKGLEVELELLGVKESVELLAAVAEIDADQTPPCCLEIAQLCGRLPLCLNIVGNLIRTFGDGWEDEIPSILKKDMKSLTTGKGDKSQPLNLQQRVIQSGLDSLEGEDAADIVALFKGMAVFAEDQIVPVAILSVLWVSIDPKEHKPLSAMKVRQWVSHLLSRSIILGSATDGVSMHDIVRDFTIASQGDSSLEQLQRSFTSTLVAGVSSQLSGTAAQATVSAYAASSLGHHLRGALSPPFANDKLASTLLLHPAPSVVAQALASVDRSDVETLAEFFLEEKEYWSASLVFYGLQRAEDNTDAERTSYMLKTLNSLKKVHKQSQPGALALAVTTSNRFMVTYPRHEEVTRIAEFQIAVAELDSKDMHAKDMTALFTAKQTVGIMLLGQYRLHYSLTVTVAQAKKGSTLFIDSYQAKYMQGRLSMPEGSFEKAFASDFAQQPYGCYTLCFTQLEQLFDYIRSIPEGIAGLARKVTDMYRAERDIPRGVARVGGDTFTGLGCSLAVVGTVVADIPVGDVVLAKWIGGALLAFQQGIFRWTMSHVFPLVYKPAMLQQALAACRISWDVDSTSAELLQMCVGRWRMERDGKEVVYNDPDTAVAIAKGLIAARFPHCVQREELSTFLGAAHGAYKHDNFHQTGLMGETRSLLCSLCARHLGDGTSAERFAQSELIFNLNPVKQLRSHMSLALAQWSKEQEAQDEDK